MVFGPFDNFMFAVGPFIVGTIFIIVFSMIIIAIIKGIREWNYNNNQPVLNVDARVVSKRTNTSSHHHTGDDNFHHSTHTSYYITFEFESRDRMEFSVSGNEYGLVAENDVGKLKFQGTRYLGFSRTR